MTEITGGTLFARALQAEGIEFLFGLPSPEIDPLLAELEAHGIRLVPVRHEAAAVHMAEGLYKTTGKVAAVLGNPGPGSSNLLPGLITALHEGVPVLAITSQHRLGIVYPSPPSTFQGQDQLDLFRPAVKWGGPIFEWSRIPEVLRLAFREMWNGRPGPVHVELPAPILYATGEDESAPIRPPAAYRARAARSRPRHRSTRRPRCSSAPVAPSSSPAAASTAPARRPRRWRSRSCSAARSCSSMAGRASVPSDHPNYVFGFGPAGDLVRARGRRAARRRIADRQPRRPLRHATGASPDGQNADPDRRRPAPFRRHAPARPRHPRRRQVGAGGDRRAPALDDACPRATARTSRATASSISRYGCSRQRRSSNGRAPASIPPTRSARSARRSAPTPCTPSTAATRRCGPTRCSRRHVRTRITRSSSSECSAPASRRRSGASSRRPSARSCASPETAPPGST